MGWLYCRWAGWETNTRYSVVQLIISHSQATTVVTVSMMQKKEHSNFDRVKT